jgi:predicted DCC family thiol-disulfide oxidoreductase YuxK
MSSDLRVVTPPQKPVLLFDGDCRFCSRWIRRWRHMTGDAVDYLAGQDASVAARFPEIPAARLAAAVHLVDVDGQVYAAAEAVVRTLAYARGRAWPARLYAGSTSVARTMEWAYRLVARHRSVFSRLTRLLWGRHVEAPTFALAQFVFLRVLGLIYLVAFLSLWSQIAGLVGHEGVLPAHDLMHGARQAFDTRGIGLDRYRLLPTLSWLGTSDGFLALECAAGTLLSVAVMVGVAQLPCLALAWLLYLSLATVGRAFFGFQWDNLLLETGFLAMFIAPGSLGPKPRATGHPRWALLMLRLLLFKLMFSSGCVKLSSGDPTWRDLSALSFHFQTQPLPTVLAWYAHRLPPWLDETACAILFAIELAAPFLVWAPRRPRMLAAALLALLQLLILLTGNYTFFNWLTLALCLLLLDDFTLRRRLPTRIVAWIASDARTATTLPRRARSWRAWLTGAAAAVVIPVSLFQTARSTGARLAWAAPVAAIEAWLDPLRTISSYGLFAVMTTERREIVVEGSDDGQAWLPYEFSYKPGDVHRRPAWVAPHQPRLDWQMWFAALGSYRDNRWFVSFCHRLLQGSPDVLALLAANPFPRHPPRYLRALLFDYTFSTAAERRATGAWWQRERTGVYLPQISLADFAR